MGGDGGSAESGAGTFAIVGRYSRVTSNGIDEEIANATTFAAGRGGWPTCRKPKNGHHGEGRIVVVTLPQPIIVAMLRQGALKLGNATIEVNTRSGFYPDIVMAGENPLRDLRRDGIVRAQARLFARNRGLALLVRRGNPLGIASIADLQNPQVRIVMASATEPGARSPDMQAPEVLMGQATAKAMLARQTATVEG